jgi:predicted PurR-regulated permease PerM
MNKPKSISFGLMLLIFVTIAALHLATPLLAALFCYLLLGALHRLFGRGKWRALVVFFVLLTAVVYGLGYFANQAVVGLPRIADQAIPSVIRWAQQLNVELPFTDYEGLKDAVVDAISTQTHSLGSFAAFVKAAGREMVFLIAGCVVAVSIFLNARMELDRESHADPNNLYSMTCDEIAERFATFFGSFARVMGAQIIISAINTVLTAAFVLAVGMPHAVVITGMTFLCGLLPVVGNLISNTVVVGVGFTVSPKLALFALAFLVTIHKLEYFLNSKIIGSRIRNPLWLTLLGLVVGEKLMGVPGMILAPVVLHYLKMETAQMPGREVLAGVQPGKAALPPTQPVP